MTDLAGKPEWRRALLAARRARSEAERAAAREAVLGHLLAGPSPALRLDVSDAPRVIGDHNWSAAPISSGAHRAAGTADAGGPQPGNRPTICVYLPLDSEPLPSALPDLLVREGWRVLLPVAIPGEPLDWAEAVGRAEASEADSADGAGPTGHDDAGRATRAPSDRSVAAREQPPFRRSAIGVLEPTGPRLGPHAVRDAAIVLVPALAVDADGFRLGRGGGFYDRTLALTDTRTTRIAVIYDDELVDALPRGPHDARVTHVLTPAHGLTPLPTRA